MKLRRCTVAVMALSMGTGLELTAPTVPVRAADIAPANSRQALGADYPRVGCE